MNDSASVREPIVSTTQLREVLETILLPIGTGRGLVLRGRRKSPYSSSFTLEELDLDFQNGSTLQLVFKNLSRPAPSEVDHTRPTFLHDPRREIEIYRRVLSGAGLGTAAFHGAVSDSSAGRYWLFLEKVAGTELYQIGEFEIWSEVARWLARFHARYQEAAGELTGVPLVRYDDAYYRQWLVRALEFNPNLEPGARSVIERLARSYEHIIERLRELPITLVHGDFYASNVLVQEMRQGIRVCPIDWELAAAGPALTDLAALTAGKWSLAEKDALALAYYEALPAGSSCPADREAFVTALDYCRLHSAVQWLGWSKTWSPPAAQANDWLGEALRLADRLGL